MSVVTFLTNVYLLKDKKGKGNRKSLKFSLHISQRSNVQKKVKSKLIYKDYCPWKNRCYTGIFFCKKLKTIFRKQVRSSHQAHPPTETGMPFPLRGSNCSLLQGFQTIPEAHSASCLWAQGCFFSGA
jgi:hypothetical protein